MLFLLVPSKCYKLKDRRRKLCDIAETVGILFTWVHHFSATFLCNPYSSKLQIPNEGHIKNNHRLRGLSSAKLNYDKDRLTN